MTPNKRDLKAYVRFDGTGRIVPSSLILRRKKPKVGKWVEIPAYECCNPTTTIGPQSTLLTIVNNSTINHGAYAGTFYVIYNGSALTVNSGTTLDAGQTMSFLGVSTLDSNNVLQLYSSNGLLPFYIDTVTDTSTSSPITYSSITSNGTNSPYVNGITVDFTIAANGITITLIDTP